MADSDIRTATGVRYGDLAPRVIVGIVLIGLALVADWIGGWAFNVLIAAVVLLLFGEWCVMHKAGRGLRYAGMFVLAGACALAGATAHGNALIVVAAGALALSPFVRMAGAGVIYAGLPAVAFIWLRQQDMGFERVLWTLSIVWATDIAAYFAGRMIGGPKIAPRISPSKTWAGLVGGMLGAGAIAALIGNLFGLGITASDAAILGAGLAIVAQAGDFFESHLKRRAGVKDSSHLLPGHGGVMDRLDGAVPVAVVVAAALWLMQ